MVKNVKNQSRSCCSWFC